ncbi:MAG: hypothetical protein IVW57_17950 [Ktedonobacterales bacterium]|nr:hypothetical protein [Ktedonobacterales bacterium]
MWSLLRSQAMKAMIALLSAAFILPYATVGVASANPIPKQKSYHPYHATVPYYVYATPNPVQESSITGNVNFVLLGQHLPALGDYRVKDTLACLSGDSINGGSTGTLVSTDFNGRFSLPVTGYFCAPGTYQLSIAETFAPHRVFYATLRIRAP